MLLKIPDMHGPQAQAGQFAITILLYEDLWASSVSGTCSQSSFGQDVIGNGVATGPQSIDRSAVRRGAPHVMSLSIVAHTQPVIRCAQR